MFGEAAAAAAGVAAGDGTAYSLPSMHDEVVGMDRWMFVTSRLTTGKAGG